MINANTDYISMSQPKNAPNVPQEQFITKKPNFVIVRKDYIMIKNWSNVSNVLQTCFLIKLRRYASIIEHALQKPTLVRDIMHAKLFLIAIFINISTLPAKDANRYTVHKISTEANASSNAWMFRHALKDTTLIRKINYVS